jgi:hypothetical protein
MNFPARISQFPHLCRKKTINIVNDKIPALIGRDFVWKEMRIIFPYSFLKYLTQPHDYIIRILLNKNRAKWPYFKNFLRIF